MKKRHILVTGAGGGGSNNLIRSLRGSSLDLEIFGSNLDPLILAKSQATHNFLLPTATDKAYGERIKKLIESQSIDLVIPNSDREIKALSDLRDQLPCRLFLPDRETVKICQNKYKMYEVLSQHDIHIAKSYDLTRLDDLQVAFEGLKNTGERVWIRLKQGSGSKGATWVKTIDQARAWIELWRDLRGYDPSSFMVCEFLPGRDYAFQSIWREGELVVAKMCERLSYFMGENRLSGMSSTPQVAKTIRDNEAFTTICKAIYLINPKPHGNYNFDMKGDIDGNMCVTEINIGRFCMITPIFDLTGQVNTAEAYVRSAFGEEVPCDDRFDVEEDMYMLRDLDSLPDIVSGASIRSQVSI